MLCFRKFPVATKFMDKRGGRDVVLSFSVEVFFFFTLPNKFIKEHFSVSLFWASRNFRDQRRWSSRFSDENVFSHST